MRITASPTNVRPGLVLLVTAAAAFVASLDLFIVNIAFNDIGHDFGGTPLSTLSWVLNGYAIIYAALLVPLGRLADRTSRRAGFLAGLSLFTVASAICATAPSVGVLVAARVLQAVGAAALTPTSLGLLLPVFAPERRANAVRIWAASGALAAAFGPVVGGLLVQTSWRWVFLVNIPIGLVTLAATVRFVPDSRDPNAGPVPDLVGALLATLAVAVLALGLVQGNDWGWGSAATLGALLGAGLTGGLFWYRNLSHPVPVVEPAMLRVRSYAWANLTSLIFSISFAASLLCAVLWLQQVWGQSPLRAGLELAPGPLMVPVFAALASGLIKRGMSVGMITATGCILCAAGAFVLLGSVGATPAYVSEVLPGWLIGGTGVGLALPTILSSATSDLPAGRAATGSAVITMSRQVGTVLGVSLLVALLGTPVGFDHAHRAFQLGWAACAILAVLAAIPALRMTPRNAADLSAEPVTAGVAT
jgi:EmrB/QacA subfamily drug resistance transporter